MGVTNIGDIMTLEILAIVIMYIVPIALFIIGTR